MSTGLLIIRLVVGLIMAGHGAQKLFGWFGGHGLKATSGTFESMGIKPPILMALLAGGAELLGGLLFAAGLWVEFGAFLIIMTMGIAAIKVHGPKGLWITNGGIEYNLVLIVVALGVALIGAGDYSLDAVWLP